MTYVAKEIYLTDTSPGAWWVQPKSISSAFISDEASKLSVCGQSAPTPIQLQDRLERRDPGGRLSTRRRDLRRAFVGEMGPNPPWPFALLKPDDRPRPTTLSPATEMQNQVLVGALRISELIEVYDPAVRQAQKIHGQYWLSGLK